MTQPEKLNLWDRFFNRTKQEIIGEGGETWVSYYDVDHPFYAGQRISIKNSEHVRRFIKYKIIDRLTGSETIKKVYLN